MPIRPELRHLYRGPAWRAIRERILTRSKYACERCGKPHGATLRVTRGGIWYDPLASGWRNDRGELNGNNYPGVTRRTVYAIRCVITIAHLDHNPHNNADDNLAALCQHCHLTHDSHFHHANARRTRAARVGQGWLSPEIEQGVTPMPLTAIAICAVLLAAALAFLRPPCFAAAQIKQPAAAPPPPAKPAWPHRHRHFWSACTRAWFGQPEAI